MDPPVQPTQSDDKKGFFLPLEMPWACSEEANQNGLLRWVFCIKVHFKQVRNNILSKNMYNLSKNMYNLSKNMDSKLKL